MVLFIYNSMDGSSHHTIFKVSPVAGQKRPAPSLLPAFEPLTSSPQLPRPFGRLTHASPSRLRSVRGLPSYLPSAPTSSTNIPTSSPPQATNTRRPGLQRTISTLSERAPLATVPSIELDKHGEQTLMGRSSNSTHFQLSTNKLISRIHVRAMYIAAKATEPKRVQIECTGWNGVKLHCQGKSWDLYKGDTFTSETEDAEIMIDVQDTRVLIMWPRQELKVLTPSDSDGTWDSEDSPSRCLATRNSAGSRGSYISPLRQQHRPHSPVSPSPAMQTMHSIGSRNITSNASPLQIYEDERSDGEEHDGASQPTQWTQLASQPFHSNLKSCIINKDSFSDHDEENDPIIHSFGPHGANLNGRLETFTTSSLSPEVRRPLEPLKEESISPQRCLGANLPSKRLKLADTMGNSGFHDTSTSRASLNGKEKEIINFAINYLMYSQLSATPLSTLFQHVTAHLKADNQRSKDDPLPESACELSPAILQQLINPVLCIGAVRREGKDASGKSLETEFYYMPEQDDNEGRREAVKHVGIGGRGLRSCRKIHKVSSWLLPDSSSEAFLMHSAILLAQAEIT